MADHNLLPNVKFNGKDVRNFFNVIKDHESKLVGKSTRRIFTQVDTSVLPIPSNILKTHMVITLCAELFFISNLLKFLLTVSRHMKFHTIHSLPDEEMKTVLPHLVGVIRLYQRCGFKPGTLLTDMEFRSL